MSDKPREIINCQNEWGLNRKGVTADDLAKRIADTIEELLGHGLPEEAEGAAIVIKMVYKLLGSDPYRYKMFVERYNEEAEGNSLTWPEVDPEEQLYRIRSKIFDDWL